mgnify:CR=1 FL=1
MKNKYDEITLLNSANMPSDGMYNKKTISKNQFIEIIKSAKVIIQVLVMNQLEN